MPSLKEIKTAVNSALKKLYPKANIYGADTVEGYSKPCFFVYVDQTFGAATKNAIHKFFCAYSYSCTFSLRKCSTVIKEFTLKKL